MGANLLPSQFLIEHHSGYRLGREELLIREVARANQRTVSMASLSQVQRGRVPITSDIAVVGGVLFVKAALTTLGRELPYPNPYPEVLRPFLHREVETMSFKVAMDRLERTGLSVFIKPADRWKSFTGCVPIDQRDFRLRGASRSERVWTSSVVRFLSEWRVYVLNGEIQHLAWYDGDRAVSPDVSVVRDAISKYVVTGAPGGFAIDFGVLSTGETALVEVNEGFAIGAYEAVPPLAYALLISTRWRELAEPRK